MEDRLVDTAGGEGGMNEESMETYTLPYGKQTASGNLLHDPGSSVNPSRVGWGGRLEGGSRGGDIYKYIWLIRVDESEDNAKTNTTL